MPTKATPEDLFDFESWLGRPKLAAAVVTPQSGGTRTIVVRANDVDDNEVAMDEAAKVPRHRYNDRLYEVLVARCIVAILPGDSVDLDKVEIGSDLVDLDGVHKLRKSIGGQWVKVVEAVDSAFSATKEPDPS